MRIVLTNDDGYNAPGLVAAYEALTSLGTVDVVAPKDEQSGCSHAITLGRPITVHQVEHAVFGCAHAIEGSPADCVRLAIGELIPEPVDLVVSGINRGANAGVDVYYSGTVAAAREGAILGLRSISLSQAIRANVETDWANTGRVAGLIVRKLLSQSLSGPGFWSVNFPAPIPPQPLDHVDFVPVAMEAQPLTFHRQEVGDDGEIRFRYGAPYWDRQVQEPSDYAVIRKGRIAISAIPLCGRF